MKRRRKDQRREETKIVNNDQSLTTSEKLTYSDVVPLDLIIDILSKLPAKSLARFVYVSKLWASIIRRRDFINSFQTRSLTQPRFLFTLRGACGNHLFFSSSPHEEPSFSINCTKSLLSNRFIFTHPVGGLVLCNTNSQLVICNPISGHIIALPKVRSRRQGITNYLGYDPIDHQYKVLCMTQLMVDYHRKDRPVAAGEHQVLTLGDEQSWRMIECSTPHCPVTNGLCINGVVYYGAFTGTNMEECALVSFNVRFENFNLIKVDDDFKILSMGHATLINYQGKVALVDDGHPHRIDLWVLEDEEKHEWSKMYVLLRGLRSLVRNSVLHITGTIHTGEIVLAPFYLCYPFNVVYYDLKRNSFRRVELEGIIDHGYKGIRRIFTFPDHIESIMLL